MVPIISDAGPIISFARAERLSILIRVVFEVLIPEGVYNEIVVRGKGKPGSEEVAAGKWTKVVLIQNRAKVKQLPDKLGAGEKEAIVLVQEMKGILLMDDPSARTEAKKLGILLTSSLNIIEEAKAIGLIKSSKTLLDELIAAGFRLSPKLYQNFLHKIGEL